MEKLNELGLELQQLKKEMLKDDYSEVVKRALVLSADSMAQNEIIDVDLHLRLTDKDIPVKDFRQDLLENTKFLKTKEEMLVEFDEIKKSYDEKIEELDIDLHSKSLVDTDELAFTKTFKINKSWVSEYFGQPEEEVDKLMVRNGFVEKFAVLRLSKMLADFFLQSEFYKDDDVDVKATHTFYDVEGGYYGIQLFFYISIEKAEDTEKQDPYISYMKEMIDAAEKYVDSRLLI